MLPTSSAGGPSRAAVIQVTTTRVPGPVPPDAAALTIDNRGVLRQWWDPEAMRRVGHTPDYRFSLANERTFLAWVRTGLALVAGGLVVAQFLPELWLTHLREALAVALMLLGATVAVRAFHHWLRCELAIRLDRDLPPSRLPLLLALAVATGAVVLVIVVVIQSVVG